MENYLSIGTYSISSDGMSINYAAPSVLPQEMMEKISFDVIEAKEEEPLSNFDTLLKGVLSVPKPKN